MTLTPSPAYVVNGDFESFMENWTTADAAALTRLLGRAENYVDLLAAGRPTVIPATDTIHSLEVTGDPTGGSFTLALVLSGVTYNSPAIRFDANSVQVSAALVSTNLPGTIMVVGGPLPFSPMYIGYRGSLGAQFVPQGSAVSSLTGGSSPAVDFLMSGAGGAVGRRFNLSSLLPNSIRAIKNAVCAQAQYMNEMQDDLFSGAQYSQVKGPDFTTTGRLPVVSPRAKREMSLAGIAAGTARSRP